MCGYNSQIRQQASFDLEVCVSGRRLLHGCRKVGRMIRKENGVWTCPDGREVCQKSAAGVREYKRRLSLMWERQERTCAICYQFLMKDIATFDHQWGRGHGGGHRDDRILLPNGSWQNAALCFGCNNSKGSKRYYWDGTLYCSIDHSVYETPDAGPEPWAERGNQ